MLAGLLVTVEWNILVLVSVCKDTLLISHYLCFIVSWVGGAKKKRIFLLTPRWVWNSFAVTHHSGCPPSRPHPRKQLRSALCAQLPMSLVCHNRASTTLHPSPPLLSASLCQHSSAHHLAQRRLCVSGMTENQAKSSSPESRLG